MGAICDQIIGCATGGGLIPEAEKSAQLQDCTARLELDCASVTEIKPEYDGCFAEVQSLSCEPTVAALKNHEPAPIPETCDGVMIAQGGAAMTKSSLMLSPQ